MTSLDITYMRRALRLAQKAEGQTRPNPPVGAVVVKHGRIIGEGFHAGAGHPHAEIEALNACRASPCGATLYVTLEPCSTAGRTPPCTERTIRDGIKRVVAGCPDPNPRHASAGFAILRAAGIEVEVISPKSEVRSPKSASSLSSLTSSLIAPFAKHITTGLPFVTLKLAMTLDGRIADRTGASKWITGEKARHEVQHLRRRCDAVMVGAGTVCADNPSLLCRLPNSGAKTRIIVDASGRTPPDAQVYSPPAEGWPYPAGVVPFPSCGGVAVFGRGGSTVVATTHETAERKGKAWTKNGAQVWAFTPDRAGRIPLRQLLKRLGKEGYLHVLCEGGAQLAGALHDAGLVDEYCFFYAPIILGDAQALSGINGNATRLKGLERMSIKEVRRVGEDLMVRVRK